MRRHGALTRLLVGLAVAATPVFLFADQAKQAPKTAAPVDLATAKPGRDPNQPIDEEYTKKIKEYTTETFFLSPLVDYLPASKTVPTPKAVLGDIAGAPGKLPYSKEVYEYMRLLEKATPRVKVFSIGKTEEGREMIAVAVASEALMAKLDANRAELAKLADPRTIEHGRRGRRRDRAARRARLLHHRHDSLDRSRRADGAHGAGVPARGRRQRRTSATSASNVITLITPIVEVDGRDRVVDLYEYRKTNPDTTRARPALLGQVRRARQQSRRDGRDAQAHRERPEHLRRLEGAGAARSARVGAVPLRQHDRRRPVQRVARSDPDQRVADDRLEQRQRDDAHRHAGRLRVRHVRHLVAGLSDVHRRDAQRHQPLVRDVRQRRQRGYGGAHALAERDVAHVVPAESAAAARDVVAAQQQQLRADRAARLAQLHREQPRRTSSATSTRRASARS